MRTLFDQAERRAGIHSISGQVRADNRTGGNNYPVSNDSAIKDDAVGTYPNIMANDNTTPTWEKALILDQLASIFKSMINRCEGTIGSNSNIVAYRNSIPSIDNAAGIDYAATTNLH